MSTETFTAADQQQWEREYRLRFPNIPRGFFMYGLDDPSERDYLRGRVHDSGAWQRHILDAKDASVYLTWTAETGVCLYFDGVQDEYALNSPVALALRRAFINIDELREGKELTSWR